MLTKAVSSSASAASKRFPVQARRRHVAGHARSAATQKVVLESSNAEALEGVSGTGASTSSGSDWAVIQVSNGPERHAFTQFVEVGRAICVQAQALSHKVGERIRFQEVMAYKRGNEALRRSGKHGFLTDVCVEGVVADEFQAPLQSHKPGQLLQKVLITKIEDKSEQRK